MHLFLNNKFEIVPMRGTLLAGKPVAQIKRMQRRANEENTGVTDAGLDGR